MKASLSRQLGRLASEALIAEASLSPKPGLVTPLSSGAHKDMDFRLLVLSARGLETCFDACASAGEAAGADSGAPSGALLQTLRTIGQEGERVMLRVTGGVNTHKGAIFCVGLLSAAVAFVHTKGGDRERLGEAACAVVAEWCSGLVERELSQIAEHVTAGERLYRESGVRGARGQAEDGYPLLCTKLLPLLRKAYPLGGERFRTACLDALLLSIAGLEDSCLLARGGISGLTAAKQGADGILCRGGAMSEPGLRMLAEFDTELISRGLSPGGSADMLAAGLFLVSAERIIWRGMEAETLGDSDHRSVNCATNHACRF